VLVDMDPAAMVAALRVPRAKLEKRQLDSAAQRVVTLRELLGPATPGLPAIQRALLAAFAERFDVEWSEEALTPEEEALAWRHHREEIGTEAFVREIDDPAHEADFAAGTHACPGGTITSYLRLEGPARKRVGQLLITGDFFVAPPRIVLDLEAALRGAYVEDIGPVIEQFFREHTVEALSVTPADFRSSIDQSVAAAARGA
jgi:lipoate-protein ligase A